jgi:ubiquitin-protein ligase
MSTTGKNYESPQMRRLRHDFAAMEQLAAESSIVRFRTSGSPPNRYLVEFRGKGLAREAGKIVISERHEVEIKLGSSYPRTIPELRWLTPIYHPNISEIGLVCLGGYNTHWVPSLHLNALIGMLWDMVRYYNYDIRSPYNREAALWAANQTKFSFPIDPRPLTDRRLALGRIESGSSDELPSVSSPTEPEPPPVEEPRSEPEEIQILDMELDLRPRPRPARPPQEDVVFLD